MGNNQSYDAPVDHPRFSKVAFATQSLSMIVKEPIISRTRVLQTWTERTKLYSHIYSNHDIARPVDYKVEMLGRCSESCEWVGRFDDKYVTSLKQQILERQSKDKYFTEEQVWHLLLVVSECASSVYSYGEKHFLGNIHPYNILVNRKDQYKILATNFSISLPGSLNHFQEYKIHGDSQAFISPQLIGFLTNYKYADYPQYPRCIDKQTAEAFCLGMTLLSMCTLENKLMKVFKCQTTMRNSRNSNGKTEANRDIRDEIGIGRQSILLNSILQDQNPMQKLSYFSKKNRLSFLEQINLEFLDSLLQKVKLRYSDTLFEIIASLIHPQTEKRMRIDRLFHEYLSPIKKQIESFDISWLNLVEKSKNMEIKQLFQNK